jgi:hypothetical protein
MQFINNLKPSEFKLIRHAASQLSGRKAKRHTYNYNLERKDQYRLRESPYKDIADSSRKDILRYLKEDGHKNDHLFRAFSDSVQLMHKHVKGHVDSGGSLSGFMGKMHGTLKNLANTARVNIDVNHDNFLHMIGLRGHKKYQDGKIDTDFRDHAQIHQDTYLDVLDRKGTDIYEYLKDSSADKYGVYKHRENGNVVFALRGTRPDAALFNNDLVEDIQIGLGKVGETSQHTSYVNQIQKLVKEHGSGNVSLSGYSKGGAEAIHLMQDKRIRSDLGQAIAISPGASPLDDQLKQKATDHKISYIYHHNDGVANANLEHSGANHHVLYSESDPLKAHLSLDRIAKGT